MLLWFKELQLAPKIINSKQIIFVHFKEYLVYMSFPINFPTITETIPEKTRDASQEGT